MIKSDAKKLGTILDGKIKKMFEVRNLFQLDGSSKDIPVRKGEELVKAGKAFRLPCGCYQMKGEK
jgi:hypothetical protein